MEGGRERGRTLDIPQKQYILLLYILTLPPHMAVSRRTPVWPASLSLTEVDDSQLPYSALILSLLVGHNPVGTERERECKLLTVRL